MEPRLLIASPQMHDPFFERTLVLVWHHDEHGAMGVVINREVEETLADILDPAPDEVDMTPFSETHVAWGGPVEPAAGTVVVRREVSDEVGWNVAAGLGVSRSMDVLVTVLRHRETFLLCLGYAGWGPGQLDDEIVAGSWLWTDLDASIVFDVAPEDRYDKALATLGLTTSTVWMQPIDE